MKRILIPFLVFLGSGVFRRSFFCGFGSKDIECSCFAKRGRRQVSSCEGLELALCPTGMDH